jgi:hypothetical protein
MIIPMVDGDGYTGAYPGRITVFFHRGNKYRSQGRGIRHGRTGDTAKNHTSYDVYFTETPIEGPHEIEGEINDTFRDAADVHQFPGKHEQGHSYHQKAEHPAPYPLGQHLNKAGGKCSDVCKA